MGLACAIPILSSRITNPIYGAFGAFIGGFLVSLPFSGFGAVIIYIVYNSFMLKCILGTWLTFFCFLNYMEAEYLNINKRVVGNLWLALLYAIPVYALYRAITYT